MRVCSVVVATLAVLSASLAGCQTPEESASNAQSTCYEQGLRPGSYRFQRCVDATYRNNRAQSDQAANATALGVGAALVGGAVLGAAINNNNNDHYRYRRYRHYRHY